MQLYLLVCCFPRVTRLKSFSLHLYTFSQFQIRFKTRLHDLKPQWIDNLSPVFATSPLTLFPVWRMLHSSNHNTFMVKKYRKWSFWKLSKAFLTMQYSVITTSPLYLYKAWHGPTDFLNCDYNGMQDEKLEIMISRECHTCTFPLWLTI